MFDGPPTTSRMSQMGTPAGQKSAHVKDRLSASSGERAPRDLGGLRLIGWLRRDEKRDGEVCSISFATGPRMVLGPRIGI